MANNLWYSWCNVGAESNDAMVRVNTAMYSDIQKYHCEKAGMGLDDPKLISVCVSFDVWVCAICALFFRGEQVLLFYSHVKWLLSFKVHLSINQYIGVLQPKSYNR